MLMRVALGVFAYNVNKTLNRVKIRITISKY